MGPRRAARALVGRPLRRSSSARVAAGLSPAEALRHEPPPRPPRLILRFALNTAIALTLAAVVILLFVRHHGTVQAEKAVAFHARFVSESILRERLAGADFAEPVAGARREELDRLFNNDLLVGGTLRLSIYRPDGQVTYSSDHGLIGTSPPEGAEAVEAFSGQLVRHADKIEIGGEKKKVLKAYVPVTLAGGKRAGALELDQDYAALSASTTKTFLPIAGALEGVLIILYISLFPALRRVTRRLDDHVAEVEHHALHDGLTALPNRTLFHDRVEHALRAAKRDGSGVAVMLTDLDRFKEVNDTLGHQAGDVLLREFAARICGIVRSADTVARLGGDEFALLTPGPRDAASALFLADRIREEMERPFQLGTMSVQVEASIGIALFPDHGDDVETLVRHADVAMYVSKRTHAPTIYAAKHDDHSPERLAVVGELRRALDNDELVVYYQPQVELASGGTPRAEALVRWQHPERGLLHPDEFIPIARHTGLIRPLTRLVLDAALGQCRAWRDQGLEIGVAVNLSGRDLLDLSLVDEVDSALRRWNLEPSTLELEIPESTLLSDPTRVRRVLTRLSEQGVRLAIDDFGSGHSSLSYVKRLPIDVIKVDKSFVSNMAVDDGDAAIVRSTIELAHDLGLVVVAEGVESEEVAKRLGDFGCDLVQGFLLSEPAPADEVTAWLARKRPGKKHLRLAG
jgi:diguanylate cyclase (GGDEF)-like protein